MTVALTPKLVAPGEGRTVMLFGVRFGYKVVSADSGGSLAVLKVGIPAKTLVKPHSHSREDEFSLLLSRNGRGPYRRPGAGGVPGRLSGQAPRHPACHMARGQRSREGGRDSLPRRAGGATSRSWRRFWPGTARPEHHQLAGELWHNYLQRLDRRPGTHLRGQALTPRPRLAVGPLPR